jgi:hypothetical protein
MYLLDTNHLSAAINPVSALRERLSQKHRQGARFRTCIPVMCELEVGIQDSVRVEAYRRQLKHLIQKVKIVPLELAIVQENTARSTVNFAPWGVRYRRSTYSWQRSYVHRIGSY